ncbi:unnamed protein product [Cuscuta campestris]|uniref:DUF4219 domain-containing protein n=1 Tax=Cuscuta campestris TaxID=132261 RepID=A0A484LDZ2_9ASTE|nr:unnamed protein product [Cuscuta campestris]
MAGRTFQPGVAEGQSTTRPPLFDETNYAYWKERMRIFIQSNDYDSWMVIKHGETVPTKIVDGVLVPKLETEYTSNDKKKMQLNARAINFLYCAVNPDDYRKISRCKTANEMWNKLEVTYEGTSKVKDSKIDLLTHEYELFMMMENETIDGMFERFSTIISNLDTLGKHYEDHVLVQKILRSLTPEWKSTVNPIKEGRDYNTLTYDALRGKLLTYEMSNFSSAVKIKRDQNLSFKGVALKASSSKYVETSGSGESDILELFNDFLQNELEQLNESTKPTCYGCGERGHIKGHFPNRKFNKSKHRKQSNYSSSSSSDDEVAICFMAQSESEESDLSAGRLGHGFGLAIYLAMVDIIHPWVSDPGIPELCNPAMGDITHPWGGLFPWLYEGKAYSFGLKSWSAVSPSKCIEARGTRVLRL